MDHYTMNSWDLIPQKTFKSSMKCCSMWCVEDDPTSGPSHLCPHGFSCVSATSSQQSEQQFSRILTCFSRARRLCLSKQCEIHIVNKESVVGHMKCSQKASHRENIRHNLCLVKFSHISALAEWRKLDCHFIDETKAQWDDLPKT